MKLIKTAQRKRKYFTETEDELASEFFVKHMEEIKKIEDDFYNTRLTPEFNDLSYKEKIENLELSLQKLYKIRDFCTRFGKGGKIYYIQMWEQMFNTNNPCFSKEDVILESIAYWQEAVVIYENLKNYILNLQISNKDTLVQNDIYKKFPAYEQSKVRKAIKCLVNEKIINREKRGNKYIITIL